MLRFLVGSLLSCLLLVPTLGWAADPLRVVVDDRYPPYAYRSPNGALQGILPDLWALWSQRTGEPVKLEGLDWAEAQARLLRGDADVIDTLFVTESRRQQYDFSPPYAQIQTAIFFQQAIGGIVDVGSLQGFTVGVKKGDACFDFLMARGVAEFRIFQDYEHLVRAAQEDDLRVMCVDEPPARYLLNRAGIADRFRLTEPLYIGEMSWAVRKGESALMARVSEGFARITTEERRAIESRWLGKTLVEPPWYESRNGVYAALGVAALFFVLLVWNSLLSRRVRKQAASLNDTFVALRESEQHFRTLANGGAALIWTSGLDGKCNYFNEPWLRFTGRPLEKELGDGWAEGVHPEDFQRCLDTYVSCFERREAFSMNYRLLHADGAYRWIRDDGNPRFDSQGVFLGYIGFCYDINEQKATLDELTYYRKHLEHLVDERTQALERAKEAAETATVAKGAFLANMSHEIRTPLNAIVGMSHLVRRGGVNPEQGRWLDKLEAASHHLLEIINAILELSKIEAGKFELDHSEVRIDRLLANIASIVQDRLQAKGLDYLVDVPPLSCRLLGDQTRLQQALLNYVSNAIKFTDSGRVAIRVLVAEEDEASVLLRFEVVDTGVGVTSQSLTRLFRPFEQVDNSMTRRYGGTGLGLAITRRLAALMDGDSGAASVPDKGSVFWFSARLSKLRPDDVRFCHSTAAEQLSTDFVGRRILLVEDDPINREITLCLLNDVHLDVDQATDGLQAIERVQDNVYDLILMDVQMPNLNGLAATERIRELPNGLLVPIVALTANVFADDRDACMAAGMDDFVTKPVDPEALFGVCLKWLERAE